MKKISIFALLIALTMPISANAQRGEWFNSQDVDARLVAGSEEYAALQIKLDEGWHTYWRIPGDSGLPPMLSWAKSENIGEVEILWPAPKRKKEYEFNTFGYDGMVTLPFVLNQKDTDATTKLALTAQIMICKDICVPQKFEVSLDVDGTIKPTEPNTIIKNAITKVPKETVEGLSIDSIVAANDSLVVSVTSESGFDGMEIFPVIEEDRIALTLPPKTEISEHDPTKAILRVNNGTDFENIAGALQGKTLTVTLVQGDKAIVKSIQY